MLASLFGGMRMNKLDTPARRDPTAPDYRLVFIGASNEVTRVERVTASSDDVAIAMAQQSAATDRVELWDSIRFIERFEPH